MRAHLPAGIIDDFKDFLESTGVRRMDVEEHDGHFGDYTINRDGQLIDFKNVEMAPPSGVMGINYSRCGLILLADSSSADY